MRTVLEDHTLRDVLWFTTSQACLSTALTVVVGLAVSALAYLGLSMLTRARSQTPAAATAA